MKNFEGQSHDKFYLLEQIIGTTNHINSFSLRREASIEYKLWPWVFRHTAQDRPYGN
jgi:hypothetical protein